MNFKSLKNFSLLILIFIISSLLITNYFFHKGVNTNKLVEDVFTVENKPEVKSIGKEKGIVFWVKELRHPIKVSGYAYQALNKSDFIKDIKIGDEIMITLHENSFKNYVDNKKDLNWKEGKYIYSYTIRTENKKYSNIDSYNASSKKDSLFGVPFGIIGYILLFYSILMKKPISQLF